MFQYRDTGDRIVVRVADWNITKVAEYITNAALPKAVVFGSKGHDMERLVTK